MITLSKCALVAAEGDFEAIKAAIGLPILRLDAAKTGSTVGEILAGRFRAGDSVPENLIILHGLDGGELSAAVDALRRAGISSLKAVSTPTNMGWTVSALYRELCRERNSMKKAKDRAK